MIRNSRVLSIRASIRRLRGFWLNAGKDMGFGRQAERLDGRTMYRAGHCSHYRPELETENEQNMQTEQLN